MKSKILNPKRMKQLIDFKGLELDNGIYPTDIDGLIEYHDSEYILLEVKHKDARVPYGQRLAIQRMVDDFTKAGKKAVAIVCEHKVDDTDKPVDCGILQGQRAVLRRRTQVATARFANECSTSHR